jgi:signal transduction histidine kinase
MKHLSRSVGLSAILILIFLLASIFGEVWLHREFQLHVAQPATLQASGDASTTARLMLMHERLFIALMVLAVVLFLIPVIILFPQRMLSAQDPGGSSAPFAVAKKEMQQLVSIARHAAAQGEALDQALSEKARAEQDLAFNQHLLDRALQEKLQLGRDLHDGLIQILYSAGLTLEAAKGRLESSPTEASIQIDQSLNLLNRSIREVRGYLDGLGPEALRAYGFKAALQTLSQELRAQHPAAVDIRVDDNGVSRLSLEQARELFQVAREGLSNALRHAQASSITLAVEATDSGTVRLGISDNGHGFDIARSSPTGHGLRNMRARAKALGAEFHIDSSPGKGTSLSLLLPDPSQTPLTSQAS